ncbi:MAG: hypothetical protein V2I27_14650 [Erythrobacter sp.]|jgi:hypothetical protein|nr:hypothetical protein [Erythrobacter sp.]
MHRTLFAPVLAAVLGGSALLGSPALASLNDQFVCETGDDRMINVTIMAQRSTAAEPGEALLSQRTDPSAPPRQTPLTGRSGSGAFRFDGGEPDAPAALADLPAAQVLGDGEGLVLRRFDVGVDVPLTFGMQRPELTAMLSRLLGASEAIAAHDECGAGAMEFERFGPLEVNFQDGLFVAWSIRAMREPHASVPIGLWDGTSPGDQAYLITERFERFEQSTLGAEYHGDGITALIDEESDTVELVMGGTNCVFR